VYRAIHRKPSANEADSDKCTTTVLGCGWAGALGLPVGSACDCGVAQKAAYKAALAVHDLGRKTPDPAVSPVWRAYCKKQGENQACGVTGKCFNKAGACVPYVPPSAEAVGRVLGSTSGQDDCKWMLKPCGGADWNKTHACGWDDPDTGVAAACQHENAVCGTDHEGVRRCMIGPPL